MSAQIRSELLKLATVRTSMYFALATAGFVALVVTIQAATAGSDFVGPLSETATQEALFLTAGIAPLIAVVFGCLLVTTELRHHTIVATLLCQPSRLRMILAKAVATLAAGASLGALAVMVSYAATTVVLQISGTPFALDVGPLVAAAAGTVSSAALGAVFGLGIGGIVQNQALAVGTVLLLMLAIEPLVSSLLPDLGPWLPSNLVTVIAEAQGSGDISLWLAAGALATYTSLTTAGAALTIRQADIT